MSISVVYSRTQSNRSVNDCSIPLAIIERVLATFPTQSLLRICKFHTGYENQWLNHSDRLPAEATSTLREGTGQQRENGRRKWKQRGRAHAPRMREIVPGLFLGNVRASYKRDMLRENRINAMVSLTTAAHWMGWNSITIEEDIPKHRHKWVQGADSSIQDLLVHVSDICDFIDQTASPALRSSSTLPVEHEQELNGKPRDACLGAILVHCAD